MSSTFDIGQPITGTASGAIPAYARVTGPIAGVFTVAGLTDRADAICLEPEGMSDGEVGKFKLLSGVDTNYGKVAGAYAAGTKLYGAADGELSDTQGIGAFAEGYAVEASTADGDVIEFRYKPELTAGS